jgi:PPOX class probable FMN-dependent enzyme
MNDKFMSRRQIEDEQYILRSADELEKLYGEPHERSILKVRDFLDEHSRAFLEAATFAVLATSDRAGNLDCSPRGDFAGFVRVLDEKTLLLPDRRGNNHTDSLKNILENPQIALLFFVPNINQTFRVGGTAQISAAPDLLAEFAVEGRQPKTVLIISVREAFVHCSRALVRAGLWQPEKHSISPNVPTMGEMLAAHTGGKMNAEEYDRELPDRVRETLY